MDTSVIRLSLTPSPPFDFVGTARSHGWVELAPNAWEQDRQAVRRVERLSDGAVVLLRITGAGSGDQSGVEVEVGHAGRLSPGQQAEVVVAVGRMFRADEDLSGLYALCRERGGQWLRVTTGLGRVLRSPTVFEDVVKVIATVNVQWGGTRAMIGRLVQGLGEPYPGDPTLRAFPTPEAIAATSPDVFAATARMGFRSDWVHTLARRVASGELDLEALRSRELATPELRKRLLAVKGVGSYAAASLLTLLGRYDELPLDTAFRAFVARKYFDGESPSDGEARAVYESWGEWRYLAYWFDIWEATTKRERSTKP